ncbi:MAG: response regulator transcription factor [Armatimonadota bacterium]
MDKRDDFDAGSIGTLTPAERSVLQAIRECGNTGSAANRLCLSLHTVRTHLRSIREKLGVHSTMEAVILLGNDGPPESEK